MSVQQLWLSRQLHSTMLQSDLSTDRVSDTNDTCSLTPIRPSTTVMGPAKEHTPSLMGRTLSSLTFRRVAVSSVGLASNNPEHPPGDTVPDRLHRSISMPLAGLRLSPRASPAMSSMQTKSAPSSVGGEFGGKTVSPKIGGARGLDVTQAMLLREAQEARQRAEVEHEADLHAIAVLEAELEAMHARLKAEREAAGAELVAARKASAVQLAAERSATRQTAELNAASHEQLTARVADLPSALETARAEAAKVKELEATIETMRREKLNAEREAMKREAVLAAEVARHKDRMAELHEAFEAARAEATKVEDLEATIEAMRQKRFSVEMEAMKREAAAAAEVTALIKSKELADTMYMKSLREMMRTSANEAQRDKDAAIASLRNEYEKKLNLLKTRVRTMMHQREAGAAGSYRGSCSPFSSRTSTIADEDDLFLMMEEEAPSAAQPSAAESSVAQPSAPWWPHGWPSAAKPSATHEPSVTQPSATQPNIQVWTGSFVPGMPRPIVQEMNERGQLEHPPRGLAHDEESASTSSGSSPAAAFFYSLGVPGLSIPSLGHARDQL